MPVFYMGVNDMGGIRHYVATGMLSLAVVAGVATASPPRYFITDLGDLAGGDNYSYAHRINAKGEVVGTSDATSHTDPFDHGWHGFIWVPGNGPGGMTDIGFFQNQRTVEGLDINNSGTVVGDRCEIDLIFRAYKWNSIGGGMDLDFVGTAAGINDDGYIMLFDRQGGGTFLRSPVGMRMNIGSSEHVPHPAGIRINNGNQICGGNTPEAEGWAFQWDAVAGFVTIPPLPGFVSAFAESLNATGFAVGRCTVVPNSSSNTRPFIWDPTSKTVRDLGVLNAAIVFGDAVGINDCNTIVGASRDIGGVQHAVLWPAEGGVVDLNDRLVNRGGWQYLVVATAINNSGWITGAGILANGDTHAFVLVPACPADLNHDGIVNDSDFEIFAAAYNLLLCFDSSMACGCPADLNADDQVDDADFVVFVAAYNAIECP